MQTDKQKRITGQGHLLKIPCNLKILRENKHLSLRKLAKEINIPHPFLSFAERGMYLLSYDQALALSIFFGVDISTIYPDYERYLPMSKES